jgi:two-component system, OmpR family, sensor histidine kinase CpxA
MDSLYWRIFLAFWGALALILVGTVTVAVNATAHRTDRPWIQRAQLYAQAAHAFESGGPPALEEWLRSLSSELRMRTFVVAPDGHEMLGRKLPAAMSVDTAGVPADPIAPLGGALVLVTAAGATFHVVVGPVRDSPRLFGELELPGVPFALLAIALLVSAAVCYLLARYLAAPVDRLRLATRRMAAGDLNVRVLPMLHRRDDLGLLAADLDTMAARLQQLLEAKQRLLRDVSHELRSPLARLQLALSLAARGSGESQRHLARIGREADRLEALIARTLKLVRLERPVDQLEQVSVDVGELLRNISADITIEADARGCRLSLNCRGRLWVSGDPELLRSAFENVIRNAVRYSPAGAVVAVSAARGSETVEVTVHDQGPGVPDKDLQMIFEPFYRVDAAREHHGAGGEGLGLAIAARSLAAHGGTIVARNAPDGGLLITVILPIVEPAGVAVEGSAALGELRESLP